MKPLSLAQYTPTEIAYAVALAPDDLYAEARALFEEVERRLRKAEQDQVVLREIREMLRPLFNDKEIHHDEHRPR